MSGHGNWWRLSSVFRHCSRVSAPVLIFKQRLTTESNRFSPTRWRGAMVAAVYAMQCLGQLLAAIVALITTASFRESYQVVDAASCGIECQIAADRSWRIIVAVGAVPACLAMYYRLTIPETPRYTFDVANDLVKADADIRSWVFRGAGPEADESQQERTKEIPAQQSPLNLPKASWSDIRSYFGDSKNVRVFAAVSLSWFFLVSYTRRNWANR